MAASVLKAGVKLGTSQLTGQSLTQNIDSLKQPKAQRVSFPIRAGSYAEELVQTAVSISILCCFHCITKVIFFSVQFIAFGLLGFVILSHLVMRCLCAF